MPNSLLTLGGLANAPRRNMTPEEQAMLWSQGQQGMQPQVAPMSLLDLAMEGVGSFLDEADVAKYLAPLTLLGMVKGRVTKAPASKAAYDKYAEEIFSALRNKTRDVPVEELLGLRPDEYRAAKWYWERSTGKPVEPFIERQGRSGFEQVNPNSVSGSLDPDDYLYHVTTPGSAGKILQHGLQPGMPPTVSNYAGHSKGNVFLTDRNGVDYWLERIGHHTEYNTGKTPRLSVVRVPKSEVSDLLPDPVGTKDAAGAKAWYVTGPVGRKK